MILLLTLNKYYTHSRCYFSSTDTVVDIDDLIRDNDEVKMGGRKVLAKKMCLTFSHRQKNKFNLIN